MKMFPIRSDLVSLALTETAGELSDVTFKLADGREVQPMHTAPWAAETLPSDVTPGLRMLRGDFFCAPFGDSDVLPDEKRSHGTTANGDWYAEILGESSMDAVLYGRVMSAAVTKHIELRPGHAVVYQRHTFAGGSGRLPVGHHAMLKAASQLRLSFGPRIFAGTPPKPLERPPAGRSILAYPQEITDLSAARLADGGRIDLTRYPVTDGHEDVWLVAADRTRPFGWTAATSAEGGWVWFALKDPRALPSTLLWLSNGGRDYPPWSGRHRRVIGVEEICSYFHLGHAASIAANPLSEMGIPTAVELRPDAPLVISYMFGLAAAPSDFGAVVDVRVAPGGVALRSETGREVEAACDPSFVTGA